MGASDDAEKKCRTLEAWLQENGVTWATDAMAFTAQDVVGGMGVVSKRAIRPGEVLANIPKSAALSIRNTSASKLIEDNGLDLDAALRVAIATEVALGARSRWHGYFKSFIKPFEDLPYLWSPEQRALLAGTDAEGTVEETLADLQSEYREVVLPLLDSPPLNDVDISLEDYLRAATLATSRAFTVDDFHLEALVPLADAFNHRCQKVPAGETVREISSPDEAVQRPAASRRRTPPFAPWQGPVPPMQPGR
ncbi:SETD6 [Symbiodinium natans]|uniref:SETD6 protein n=1 Tax=Symbiodinium natans TaxID=878477 RepID=A0A812RE29_9DINO|nr:SETD6 [Symbiodinium natans]